MPISKVQLEVWKVRRELDRELANMTPRQRNDYFSGASDRIEAQFGKKLGMRRAKLRRGAIAERADRAR